MADSVKYINNARKPKGMMGKKLLNRMNGGRHAELADFGLDALPEGGVRRMADLGCGGGRNVAALLARYADAYCVGIDYSPLAVRLAAQYNAQQASRCRLMQSDVAALPLEAGAYDLITAFETVYFWGDLGVAFANVYAALSEGGTFMIVNETDGMDEEGRRVERLIEGMTVYTADELCAFLRKAGFASVEVRHHHTQPWIAVYARK